MSFDFLIGLLIVCFLAYRAQRVVTSVLATDAGKSVLAKAIKRL